LTFSLKKSKDETILFQLLWTSTIHNLLWLSSGTGLHPSANTKKIEGLD